MSLSNARHIGIVPGRLVLLTASLDPNGRSHACRTEFISSDKIKIVAACEGNAGQRFAAYFEPFGMVSARIERSWVYGFDAAILHSGDSRGKLTAKIDWLNRNSQHRTDDRRKHKRFIPRHPHAVLRYGDSEIRCFVVDYSVSGIALSADADLHLNEMVRVGGLRGRIVRYFEGGVGVEFDRQHSLDELDTAFSVEPEYVMTAR